VRQQFQYGIDQEQTGEAERLCCRVGHEGAVHGAVARIPDAVAVMGGEFADVVEVRHQAARLRDHLRRSFDTPSYVQGGAVEEDAKGLRRISWVGRAAERCCFVRFSAREAGKNGLPSAQAVPVDVSEPLIKAEGIVSIGLSALSLHQPARVSDHLPRRDERDDRFDVFRDEGAQRLSLL